MATYANEDIVRLGLAIQACTCRAKRCFAAIVSAINQQICNTFESSRSDNYLWYVAIRTCVRSIADEIGHSVQHLIAPDKFAEIVS